MYFKIGVLVWELPKQGVVSNLGCPKMVCGHACSSLLMQQGSRSTDSFHLKMLCLNKDTGCALLSNGWIATLRSSHAGRRPMAALRALVFFGPATALLHCGWLSLTACRRCPWGKCACLKDTPEIQTLSKLPQDVISAVSLPVHYNTAHYNICFKLKGTKLYLTLI